MNTTIARVAVTIGALTGAAALLAACGSSGGNTPAAPAATPGASSSTPAQPGGTTGGNRFGPAASGKIAAINGKTVQVQNQQSGQVAVQYTAKTKFSQTVSTTLKKIKQGDCVTAVAPSGTSSSATSFTATRITLSKPVNGSCTGGFGGRGFPGGARPSGAPSFPGGGSGFPGGGSGFPNRSGFPSNLPSGFPSGGRFPGRGSFGTVASGKVSSVSGSKLVVAARQFTSGTTGTKSITVSVGGSTTITTTAAGNAKALKVGKCLTAQGSADATGAVRATQIEVTPATNGQCSTGFGGFGGR